MRRSLRSLRFLPLAAGTAWSVTLFILLLVWLVEGRPRYPSQSNPYVAYISDIGALRLQPLFIVGAVLTALTLFGTILTVHLAFHQTLSQQPQAFTEHRWRRSTTVSSVLACILALASCACQICVPIFNKRHHPQTHQLFLSLALAGTALTAVCTTITFWGEMWPRKNPTLHHHDEKEAHNETLRRRCIIVSNSIFLIEILLGACFVAFLWTDHYRIAGILEWILSFVLTGYFWAFAGFLIPCGDAAAEGEEETPLLR